jgi:hypothetical protein
MSLTSIESNRIDTTMAVYREQAKLLKAVLAGLQQQ